MPKQVLDEGIWIWLWPQTTWDVLEPDVIGPKLKDLGIVGVIPQAGLSTLSWLTSVRVNKFASHGLKVCVGFGFDSSHASLDQKAQTLIDAAAFKKANPNVVGVEIDWEGYWDGKQSEAKYIVDKVLAAHPDANQYFIDAPWWCPLFLVGHDGIHHPTHPSAPTKEFGVLCANDRYPQAYGRNGHPGTNDGASTSMLNWSRHPSQYASLGNWIINPAYQAYNGSLNDQITTLLNDKTVALWDVPEWDANCINALKVVKKLKDLGLTGPTAVKEFQTKNGLTVDGIVGQHTLLALGITV